MFSDYVASGVESATVSLRHRSKSHFLFFPRRLHGETASGVESATVSLPASLKLPQVAASSSLSMFSDYVASGVESATVSLTASLKDLQLHIR